MTVSEERPLVAISCPLRGMKNPLSPSLLLSSLSLFLSYLLSEAKA